MPSIEGVDDNVPPTGYGVRGKSNIGGRGVRGESSTGPGVYGESNGGPGVWGWSKKSLLGFSSGIGVIGSTEIRGTGVYGESINGYGVYGWSRIDLNTRFHPSNIGVAGISEGNGTGVSGESNGGTGVSGRGKLSLKDSDQPNRTGGTGVAGSSEGGTGVFGISGINEDSKSYGNGVFGSTKNNVGVKGDAQVDPLTIDPSKHYQIIGIHGDAYVDPRTDITIYMQVAGVYGFSNRGDGVQGKSYSRGRAGVYGDNDQGYGVFGASINGNGLHGWSQNGYAAFLDGKVHVKGLLEKSGASTFKIDHPLDPANKYLRHSIVESPDMKNVYDGVVVLDKNGEAEIELPDWFGALNKEFRYQLTAIGAPGPNLYIAQEIPDTATTLNYSSTSSTNNKNNSSRFKIAGGTSDMKVSWQVTGIRKDVWANAHPIQVEEDKPANEQGYYIYPELYGQPEEKDLSRLLFPKQEEEKWQEIKRVPNV